MNARDKGDAGKEPEVDGGRGGEKKKCEYESPDDVERMGEGSKARHWGVSCVWAQKEEASMQYLLVRHW